MASIDEIKVKVNAEISPALKALLEKKQQMEERIRKEKLRTATWRMLGVLGGTLLMPLWVKLALPQGHSYPYLKLLSATWAALAFCKLIIVEIKSAWDSSRERS